MQWTNSLKINIKFGKTRFHTFTNTNARVDSDQQDKPKFKIKKLKYNEMSNKLSESMMISEKVFTVRQKEDSILPTYSTVNILERIQFWTTFSRHLILNSSSWCSEYYTHIYLIWIPEDVSALLLLGMSDRICGFLLRFASSLYVFRELNCHTHFYFNFHAQFFQRKRFFIIIRTQ